jgi:exosortase
MAYQKTKKMDAKPSYTGLPFLLLGLLFFLISMRTIQPRLALIGAPFVVIGYAYYVFGFQIAKHIIFPSFFLWFSVPVPGLEAILTGNLQVLITKACYHTGIFLGMDLVNTGADIYIGGSSVKVAEGCSGIRSLMALTMIAAVYANYTQKSLWKKAFLFALALPLAIAGNFLRIFTILVLAQFGYADFGTGTWHDWAGLLIFFPIALSGLYLADYFLNFKEKRSKRVKRSVKKSHKVVKETATL